MKRFKAPQTFLLLIPILSVFLMTGCGSSSSEKSFAFGGNAKPEPVAEVKPEPVAEVAPEPVAEAKPEPVAEVAPEPVAEVAPEPVAEVKVIVLALEDVHFNFDKSTVTEEAKVVMKRNFQILKDNPEVNVRIAGYTSAHGTEEYNQKLSERRAKAVKDYFMGEGIVGPGRFSEIGYGEKNPAVHEAVPKNKYSDAAKANMRVLFEINVK